ncbi:MAG TPA: NYN domain-containing protein [Ktedonobacterales bacterium]
MSQTTFDPTTPGGSSDNTRDDTGERTNVTNATPGAQGATAPHGQTTRHRSTRRGGRVSATAKSAAAETTPAQPAAEEAPVASAAETPASAEEPRSGRRGPRGGAAKRPATRGKTSAQLIITKAPDESSAAEMAEAPEATSALETPEAVAASEPVVVPVVSAPPTATGAGEPPATPRKTRFGLPRRLQQPAPAAAAPAPAAEAAVPSEPLAIESAAEAAASAEEAALAPRYRFDRSRRASAANGSAAAVRPERLASQRPGLYTNGETAAETTPAAPEPLFDLPSLDALVGPAGGDLPTLAFEAPAPTEHADDDEAPDAEQPEDGADAAEADGASGTSRRRRRRRRGSSHNGVHGGDLDESLDDLSQFAPTDDALKLLETAEPEAPAAPSEPPAQEPPQEPQPAPRGRSTRFGYPGRTARRAPAEPGWDAAPQQAAQPAAQQPAAPQQQAAEMSPYSSPEPSFARGFGPTPSGVATPVRESYPRTTRVERGVDPVAAAVAQVGSVIREAIGAQTDRLLTEMRHQQPPAVTVSIPNATTAERVGVFVDVANVVYSLRGLRYSVDFGRMLDFLRANRRLARAQAYAPTNPEPGADQSFLNAVKGMGYRITTKNYKTFSNGAKKADLDLDLCMDIVRLVEARAVDTIVLVSGDSDFLPLLDFCYDHGVRVEVAAFDDAASMILRQSCDLFVNLSLVDVIRG